MSKRYYWLKLNENFFDRDEIKIIEDMPNGKDYIIFYMKLLLKSIKSNGELRFRDVIPYTPEMLSSVTNINIDTVKVAIDLFTKLGLMEIWDNGTLFMNETQNMIGHETEWAKKKREYREKTLVKEDNVLELSEPCPSDVRQEIDIEIELDKEIDIDNKAKKIKYAEYVSMKEEEYNKLIEKYGQANTTKMVEILDNYKGSTGKKYKNDYRAVLSWVVDKVKVDIPKDGEKKFTDEELQKEQERLNNLIGGW